MARLYFLRLRLPQTEHTLGRLDGGVSYRELFDTPKRKQDAAGYMLH